MIDKILEFIKPIRKILLFTHNNPDPDSIASAFALKNLFSYIYKKRCTIAYRGIIGRAQNRELVKVCSIKMFNAKMLNPVKYDCIVLVDTQPGSGNIYLTEKQIPHIVIDHHYIRSATKKAKIIDVRPNIGSTSTIVIEYYKKLNIPFDKNTATALYYGIKTDTIGAARNNTKLDLEMMSYVTPYISLRKLSKIEEPEIPRYYFKNLHIALERVEVINELIFCNLDEVRNADFIAEMSDFLIRMRDIKWSLVMGKVDKGCYFSLRCKLSKKFLGNIATEITRGIGYGGGHLKSAGGQIPLENNKLLNGLNEKEKYEKVVSIVKKRFLNIIFKNNNIYDKSNVEKLKL
ncbi:MAG: bifunctional oligoribonuclease/PAP phosphatase NrnA [Deferribacterota bacterium]|nr:bifunctional oligoribonuclease/PAP phosphatase NrnA [Deferribacterota bacterium]